MQPKNLAFLFSKDETCSFLARLKHLKLELPRQDGKQLNITHKMKCKFSL